MKVNLIAHTPEPEKLVAAAAKLCYSPVGVEEIMENLDDKKIESFLNMLVDIGHESPIEHISFTFAVEGVARVTEIQLIRHRIGCSYSIQSGRYVRRDNAQFSIPPAIMNNEFALKEFLKAIDVCNEAYESISQALLYQYLCEYRTEKGLEPVKVFSLEEMKEIVGDKKVIQAFEKKAAEDARYIQPQSLQTKLVFTMTARALLNFFNHRCCNRAQWEIHAMADEMLRLVREVAPTIFKNAGPSCLTGPCPEGSMTCGKITEVRRKYKGESVNGK